MAEGNKKATKVETEARVQHLLTLMLDGAELPKIRQDETVQSWAIKERQLLRLMERANVAMVSVLVKDRERSVARHHAMRRALYARCVQKQDLRTAYLVLKDIADLEGLYVDKLALTDPTGTMEFGHEQATRQQEIEARLAVLFASHAAGGGGETARRIVGLLPPPDSSQGDSPPAGPGDAETD